MDKRVTSGYAAYGMTIGTLTKSGSTALICGIITSGWPAWGFVTQSQGWKIDVIIHKGSLWRSLMSK